MKGKAMTHALAAAILAGTLNPSQPAPKPDLKGKSTCSNPVAVVFAVVRANPTLSRSQQLDLCKGLGVAHYTARTQIQEARKALRLEAAAALAAEAQVQAS